MRDFGYDVADYRDVDPLFGTLADLDAPDRRGARARHPGAARLRPQPHLVGRTRGSWTRARRATTRSATGTCGATRRPAAGRPTNWRRSSAARRGRSTRRPASTGITRSCPSSRSSTGATPAVRDAMLDVMRFWFARGIDGFRIDVLWMIAKDECAVADDPIGPGAWRGSAADPTRAARARRRPGHGGTAARAARRRRRVPGAGARRRGVHGAAAARPLLRRDGPGAHLPFNFALVTLPWDAARSARAVATYEAALPADAWPNWVLGNHDQSRVASRVGRGAGAGRGDAAAHAPRHADAVLRRRAGPAATRRCRRTAIVDVAGRDPERSPMPWTGAPHAGFSTAEPWLPMVDDAARLERRGPARRPGIDAPAPPAAPRPPPRVAGAPRRRLERRRGARRASSRSTGPARNAFRVLLNLAAGPSRSPSTELVRRPVHAPRPRGRARDRRGAPACRRGPHAARRLTGDAPGGDTPPPWTPRPVTRNPGG